MDGLARPLQDLQTKRLPLLPDLAIPAGVILAIRQEGGFVHRCQCTLVQSIHGVNDYHSCRE